MAYDETLAHRIRVLFRQKKFAEKKMFGGLSFMHRNKMCVGILKQTLVVRIAPEKSEGVLNPPNVKPMTFTGKPMKGFLFVEAPAYRTDAQLKKWVEYGIDFIETSQKKTLAPRPKPNRPKK